MAYLCKAQVFVESIEKNLQKFYSGSVTGSLPRFSFRQLEYFVAVAEAGTLAAAAERHHVSQSAISLAISDLERALDVQLLLRRKSRGTALTDAGREVLPQIRSLLSHAGEVQSTARSIGQSVAGELKVACYPTLTPFLMPEALSGFAALHPSVAVQLAEGSVSEIQARLLDGTCELALMYDLGIGPDIATRLLYEMRPYVLLPADHRLAAPGPIGLKELAGEPMVLLEMPPSAAMFREVLASAGVEPNVRFVTASFESVRSLVASGAGYSLLLQRPAADSTYAGPPLFYREISNDVRQVSVVLAHAAEARLTRRAQVFASFCVDRFGRSPRTKAGPRLVK